MGLINVDVGSVISGIGTLAKDIRAAITGKSVLSAEKAAELEIKLQELESGAMSAQAAINQAEAANPSLFVSGWRPFIGWICGGAFAYSALLGIFTWIATLCGVAAPPTLNAEVFQTLLFGMLGLATARTVEKVQMGKN